MANSGFEFKFLLEAAKDANTGMIYGTIILLATIGQWYFKTPLLPMVGAALVIVSAFRIYFAYTAKKKAGYFTDRVCTACDQKTIRFVGITGEKIKGPNGWMIGPKTGRRLNYACITCGYAFDISEPIHLT